MRAIDYTGSKFNKLTLLHYLRSGGAGMGAIWRARCDCGNIREVVGKDVAAGKLKTCGKCELSRKLQVNRNPVTRTLRSSQRKLFGKYMDRALRKGVRWDLSPEEFLDLISRNCVLCDEGPRMSKISRLLAHNNIGRINQDKPYTLANCYPCCPHCSTKVGQDNLQEYLNHISRTLTNIQSKKINS